MLSRKKLIFSSLVGLALVTFTGCTGSNDGTKTETQKCQAGKCGEGKCGGETKKLKHLQKNAKLAKANNRNLT